MSMMTAIHLVLHCAVQAPWEAWQEHMGQLFRDFLVPAPARIILKEYAPQHFEGPLGIDPGYAPHACRANCVSCAKRTGRASTHSSTCQGTGVAASVLLMVVLAVPAGVVMRDLRAVLLLRRYARELEGGPWQTECAPASVGEFWFNDWMRSYLADTCKGDCSHVQASTPPFQHLLAAVSAL